MVITAAATSFEIYIDDFESDGGDGTGRGRSELVKINANRVLVVGGEEGVVACDVSA
jgi:hypothetical protein